MGEFVTERYETWKSQVIYGEVAAFAHFGSDLLFSAQRHVNTVAILTGHLGERSLVIAGGRASRESTLAGLSSLITRPSEDRLLLSADFRSQSTNPWYKKDRPLTGLRHEQPLL
jgi:hypothetical protein